LEYLRNIWYWVANRHKPNYKWESGLEAGAQLKRIDLEASAQPKGVLDDKKPE
jgi:hypothetical protein